MPTLGAILDAIIYGQYSWYLNGGKGLGYVGIATGGAATTLIDTTLRDTGADASTWLSFWKQRPTAAAADLYRRVATYTNTSGTLTHGGPDYAVVPASGEAYRLSYIDPRVLMQCINAGLNECVVPYWGLATLVTDGDMETSGTTAYTATTAALAKQTGSENVFSGEQSLRVTNSALNGQAASSVFYTYPNTAYIIIVKVRGANFTPILLVLDAASATIDSITGSNQTNDWQVLQFTVTTPNSVAGRSMSIVLRGSEAGAILEWDCVSVLASSQKRLILPSWIEHQNDLGNIIAVDFRGASLQNEVYRADGYRQFSWGDYRAIPEITRLRHATPGRSVQVAIEPGYDGSGMLYAEGMRRGASLGTTETATTHIPLELAVAAAYKQYCQGLPEYPIALSQFTAAYRRYVPRLPVSQPHRMQSI